jgi:hypothetical protein
VGLMGEGAECVPVVVIWAWPDLEFNDEAVRAEPQNLSLQHDTLNGGGRDGVTASLT